MTARTGFAWAARAALTSARLNSSGFGWLGVARNGADDTGITASQDVTNAAETVFVHTGRMILVQGVITVSCTAGVPSWSAEIIEGGTNIGRCGRFAQTGSDSAHIMQGAGFAYQSDPGNGNHTYKLHFTRQGSGTYTLSGTSPAQATIFIQDVGSIA